MSFSVIQLLFFSFDPVQRLLPDASEHRYTTCRLYANAQI